MQSELALKDILNDPLIALLRRADGISNADFEHLLNRARDSYRLGAAEKRAIRVRQPVLPVDDGGIPGQLSHEPIPPRAATPCLCL